VVGPALQYPRPISAREPACQPITVPLSPTDGARLSVPSSPKSPSSARPAWQRRPNCRRWADHPSPPLCCEDAHVCACRLEPSHRLRCVVASRHRCRIRLPLSALHRSDSRANRSVMRPRAGCFAPGQLLPHLYVPLGRPVPSLIEASCRPAGPVDCCQGRWAATMPRQVLGDDASRSASASTFLADTACGPSSLQLPSHVSRRCHALAHPCAPCGPIQCHRLSTSLPRRRRTNKTPSASSPRKSPVVVRLTTRLRPRVRARTV
jgi:hypothetical protein